MSQALHPMLNTAIKAARGAGSIINRASLDLDRLQVNTKAPNDFVTEVDLAAEAVIIDTLLGAYPGHGILAEETGSSRGAADSEFVWIIDPLDGTTNFIHGFPTYAVSIALAHRNQVQQAVVYDPARNDLFFASKGRGAFLNDKRLRVSKRTRMAEALIGTGFPVSARRRFRRLPQGLQAGDGKLRRPRAARARPRSTSATWPPAGTTASSRRASSPGTWAAGSLMVSEAGGLVGNFTGNADFLHRREVIAGNPKIYGQLVRMLASHSGAVAVVPGAAEADGG